MRKLLGGALLLAVASMASAAPKTSGDTQTAAKHAKKGKHVRAKPAKPDHSQDRSGHPVK